MNAPILNDGIILPPDSRKARLGVLINMRSGRNRSGMDSVETILAARPEIVVRRTHDRAEVRSALIDFAAAGIDVLAVSGGDGTLQRVLNLAINEKPFAVMPLIALMPGGTTNMIAYDIGTVRKRGQALAALLKRIDAGALAGGVVVRSLLRLDGGDTRYPRHGLFFGAAGVYEATTLNRKSVDAMGFRDDFGPGLRIAAILGRLMIGQDPVRAVDMRLNVDGLQGAPSSYLAVFASTMERLSLNMRPFWGTGEGPIRMTTVAKGARTLFRAAWPMLRGRQSRLLTPARGYESRNITEVELVYEGGSVLDGEFYFASHVAPLRLGTSGRIAFVTG